MIGHDKMLSLRDKKKALAHCLRYDSKSTLLQRLSHLLYTVPKVVRVHKWKVWQSYPRLSLETWVCAGHKGLAVATVGMWASIMRKDSVCGLAGQAFGSWCPGFLCFIKQQQTRRRRWECGAQLESWWCGAFWWCGRLGGVSELQQRIHRALENTDRFTED